MVNFVAAGRKPASLASARYSPGSSVSSQVDVPQGLPFTLMSAPDGLDRKFTLRLAAAVEGTGGAAAFFRSTTTAPSSNISTAATAKSAPCNPLKVAFCGGDDGGGGGATGGLACAPVFASTDAVIGGMNTVAVS